jgi:hypothetical protein
MALRTSGLFMKVFQLVRTEERAEQTGSRKAASVFNRAAGIQGGSEIRSATLGDHWHNSCHDQGFP